MPLHGYKKPNIKILAYFTPFYTLTLGWGQIKVQACIFMTCNVLKCLKGHLAGLRVPHTHQAQNFGTKRKKIKA